MDRAAWAPTFTVDAEGDQHRLYCHSCGVTWPHLSAADVRAVRVRHTEEARCARGLPGAILQPATV